MNKPRRRATPVSELLKPALADALKARGFAAADILIWWEDIAGPRLAERSVPLEVQWPPRPKGASADAPLQPATLVLKVDGAFAFEVEMQAAQIVERVNAMLGWRCVGRVRLRQGPVERPDKRVPPKAPALEPAAEASLAGSLSGIADPALRDSLHKLGRAVLARRPVTRA